MSSRENGRVVLAVIGAIVIVIIGYYVLNTPDTRDIGQKMGDAVNELPNGPEKAARQLEDRTPGEKLRDAAEDEKKDIKKAINQP